MDVGDYASMTESAMTAMETRLEQRMDQGFRQIVDRVEQRMDQGFRQIADLPRPPPIAAAGNPLTVAGQNIRSEL